MKDKQIPKGYPLQKQEDKVEMYNKIVIAEFLQVEALIDMKKMELRNTNIVNSYNYEREHMEE